MWNFFISRLPRRFLFRECKHPSKHEFRGTGRAPVYVLTAEKQTAPVLSKLKWPLTSASNYSYTSGVTLAKIGNNSSSLWVTKIGNASCTLSATHRNIWNNSCVPAVTLIFRLLVGLELCTSDVHSSLRSPSIGPRSSATRSRKGLVPTNFHQNPVEKRRNSLEK